MTPLLSAEGRRIPRQTDQPSLENLGFCSRLEEEQAKWLHLVQVQGSRQPGGVIQILFSAALVNRVRASLRQ